MRLDANMYRRDVSNYADDDQLLNTGISYPIAFNHAVIYGAEGKFELIRLGSFSGFVSYSSWWGMFGYPSQEDFFLARTRAARQVNFPDSFPILRISATR